MSDLSNFEVDDQINDSAGAVIIAGKPIASGTPTDGQMLVYSTSDGQWQFQTPAVSHFFAAVNTGSFTPVLDQDFSIPTDVTSNGTAISRLSSTTFTVQPGLYRFQFSLSTGTFDASGSAQNVSYRFYDQTAAAFFGNQGDVVGFAPATTVEPGVGIDEVRQFLVPSDISVRAIAVAGTTPELGTLALNIYKLD